MILRAVNHPFGGHHIGIPSMVNNERSTSFAPNKESVGMFFIGFGRLRRRSIPFFCETDLSLTVKLMPTPLYTVPKQSSPCP